METYFVYPLFWPLNTATMVDTCVKQCQQQQHGCATCSEIWYEVYFWLSLQLRKGWICRSGVQIDLCLWYGFRTQSIRLDVWIWHFQNSLNCDGFIKFAIAANWGGGTWQQPRMWPITAEWARREAYTEEGSSFAMSTPCLIKQKGNSEWKFCEQSNKQTGNNCKEEFLMTIFNTNERYLDSNI